jgi:hypothetical protein
VGGAVTGVTVSNQVPSHGPGLTELFTVIKLDSIQHHNKHSLLAMFIPPMISQFIT